MAFFLASLFRRSNPPTKQMNTKPDSATPAAANDALLSTGEVCARLGFNVTAAFLMELGFKPEPRPGSGKFWKASEYPAICQALMDHISGRF